MKKGIFWGAICSLFAGFIFAACDSSGGGGGFQLTDYQNVGASVAAKKWTETYDCSNFSTQFYQNCYQAGLPCRVRAGQSGGRNFSRDNHAWNSVKINGTWVNWEPQLNAVYDGHTQTQTKIGSGWGKFYEEDIVRIIYETVGRYVPKNIIDAYEIDTYWNTKSPFYLYFISKSYCLSNDPDQNAQMISFLQNEIPDNDSGDIFITTDYQHLFFFFKHNNQYYAIENLETADPVEGRNITGKKTLDEILNSDTVLEKLNITLGYGVK
jgi:hypothetical protein